MNETCCVPKCDVPKLWQENRQVLGNFIRKRVADRATAADLEQEVLLKVYRFCLQRTGIRNVRSWLFRIAQNAIIDHQRRAKKLAPELPDLPEKETGQPSEMDDFVGPIIALLPAEYADPLRLADLESVKQAEIAERLGLTLTAAKSRIQRGRMLFKKQLLACCEVETDGLGNLVSVAVRGDCSSLQKLIREKKLAAFASF